MIYVASDHAGYPTKLKVLALLEKHELEFEDLGTNTTDSVDYPDYAKKLAEKVVSSPNSVGILICRTGIGMSIAVNRFKGIRGALCRSEKDVRLAREHNNANVLVLGSTKCCAKRRRIIKEFLNAKFEGGRHERRVEKLDKIN